MSRSNSTASSPKEDERDAIDKALKVLRTDASTEARLSAIRNVGVKAHDLCSALSCRVLQLSFSRQTLVTCYAGLWPDRGHGKRCPDAVAVQGPSRTHGIPHANVAPHRRAKWRAQQAACQRDIGRAEHHRSHGDARQFIVLLERTRGGVLESGPEIDHGEARRSRNLEVTLSEHSTLLCY